MSEAINELEVVADPPDGQLPESVDKVMLYAEYRRITADQAALRRLAMLVAQGAEPAEVFEAVVNEMRLCASADTAGLWRYESNNEMTKLAAAEHPRLHLAKWPVGTRSPVDGATLRRDSAAHGAARQDGQLPEQHRVTRSADTRRRRTHGGRGARRRRWTRVGPGGRGFG
jgi:hypothetical protein